MTTSGSQPRRLEDFRCGNFVATTTSGDHIPTTTFSPATVLRRKQLPVAEFGWSRYINDDFRCPCSDNDDFRSGDFVATTTFGDHIQTIKTSAVPVCFDDFGGHVPATTTSGDRIPTAPARVLWMCSVWVPPVWTSTWEMCGNGDGDWSLCLL